MKKRLQNDIVNFDGNTFVLSKVRLLTNNIRACKIENSSYKNEIMEKFQRTTQKEHGCQPISFTIGEVPSIFANEKFLCGLKTDGERASLFLTTINDKPKSFFIFRSKTVFEVEIESEDDFFKGSSFDGEIVTENDINNFVVFDVSVIKGLSTKSSTYTDRLSILNQIEKDISFLPHSGVYFSVKKCIPAANCMSLWNTRFESKHLNDGLIFTHDSDEKIYKLKKSPTIDVLAERDVLKAYAKKGSENILIKSLKLKGSVYNVLKMTNNSIISAAFQNTDSDFLVFECLVRQTSQGLEFFAIKCRFDKQSPNHIYVITQTVQCVVEKNGIQSFCKAIKISSSL